MKKYTRVKWACYSANMAMSVVGNLSPLLFLTFQDMYGISYTLLGTLVLVNFCTQLSVDLIFSFFSHKFHIPTVLRVMPVLATVGLLIYCIVPWITQNSALVYTGLLVGTVIFSASSGLAEVLISPVIASIPAENPEREMSKLHSVYAWGVVGVVIFATLFLLAFKSENWQWLTLTLVLIPLVCTILFAGAKIPEMEKPEKTSDAIRFLKNKGVWLLFFGMFLSGSSECTMGQWASSYLEQALGIPKVFGDVFGVAMFSVALGLGRTLYGKFGKNIGKILFLGSLGATACYLTAVFSPFPVLGLIACAITGFCVSMLWPGSLIVSSDKFPTGGVLIFALMASGGDLGVSVGPQAVGVVTDLALKMDWVVSLAENLGMTAEQCGMRLGMLVGAIFPLLAIFVYGYIWKAWGKKSASGTPKMLSEK